MASFAVTNMLVGVLVDVVICVASAEKEETALNEVKTKLQEIFYARNMDPDNDRISKAIFFSIIEDSEAARSIHDLGVNIIQLIDAAETIFAMDEDCVDSLDD